MSTDLNYYKMAKQYSNEEEAYKFLEATRWENGILCPHCQNIGASFIPAENGYRKTRTGKTTYRRVWRCDDCKKQFSVLVGTIFEDSRIPLSKWLLAIHELNADKNGISSCELARKLGITQKSAWFMAQRIRFAMAHTELEDKRTATSSQARFLSPFFPPADRCVTKCPRLIFTRSRIRRSRKAGTRFLDVFWTILDSLQDFRVVFRETCTVGFVRIVYTR